MVDALGGPDAPGAGATLPPDLHHVRIEFRITREAWSPQTIVLTFNDVRGEAEEHLMALWRLWHGAQMERIARDGTGPLEIG